MVGACEGWAIGEAMTYVSPNYITVPLIVHIRLPISMLSAAASAAVQQALSLESSPGVTNMVEDVSIAWTTTKSGFEFGFRAGEACSAKLTIYSPTMWPLRVLVKNVDSGYQKWLWDGLDENGNNVPEDWLTAKLVLETAGGVRGMGVVIFPWSQEATPLITRFCPTRSAAGISSATLTDRPVLGMFRDSLRR
jgi:hypothetical protein